MKISSGVDTQELLAVLREGGYLSVGGAPLKEILSRLEQAEEAVARVRSVAHTIPEAWTRAILHALDGETRG